MTAHHKKWARDMANYKRVRSKRKGRRVGRVRRISPKGRGFYDTQEWQMLRYKVLVHYGRQCMVCRRIDVELHVDHIKPRSKYPHLELVFDNLQVLCKDCNLGKSNLDETDWRPKDKTPDAILKAKVVQDQDSE